MAISADNQMKKEERCPSQSATLYLPMQKQVIISVAK
jgi:hypothetical protein